MLFWWKHKQSDGILGSDEIARLVAKHRMIEPFVPRKISGTYSYGLEPNGYTFRLANEIYIAPPINPNHMELRNPETPRLEKCNLSLGENLIIPPNAFAVCRSLEYFRLPPGVVAFLFGKSTFTRQGLCFMFAFVDSGYEGHITFSVKNLSPFNIELVVGEGIAQIVFYRSESVKGKYEGRYQGSEGIVLPER